jgi:hypothetical protein
MRVGLAGPDLVVVVQNRTRGHLLAGMPAGIKGPNGMKFVRFGPFLGVPESLTRGKSGKKESPRLPGQNRRMFPAMRTILQSSCERVQLTLTVVLLVACAANVALVCAWL